MAQPDMELLAGLSKLDLPEAWWCNVAWLWLSVSMVQRSIIWKKAIACDLNPTAGRHAKV
jgi:hypothetical protein